MQKEEEATMLRMLRDSLLPGQEGITIRAFLAFNRENPLATREKLEQLQAGGSVLIKDEQVFPLETL
jgi:hypothetical protein